MIERKTDWREEKLADKIIDRNINRHIYLLYILMDK